jgi:putative transcriptional regulator
MTSTKASHPDTSPDEPIMGGSILLAPENDPDAQPLTHEDISRMRRTPQVKIIRRALGLSQELFSEQFRIPLGTGCRCPRLSESDRTQSAGRGRSLSGLRKG